MKRHPVSMKEEREILISAIKDLVDVKHRLADLSDSVCDVSQLYKSDLVDAEMEIDHICGNIGNMIGFPVYSDICEGLEVMP